MRTKSILALLALLLLTPTLLAAPPDPLPAAAQKIADQITADPQINPDLYAPSFLKAAPAAQLAAICKSLHHQLGPVQSLSPQSTNTPTDGKFTFHFADADMPATLTLESAAPNRIAGLWFGPPVAHLQSLDEITAHLAKLPGQTGFLLQNLDNGKILASLHPHQPLAIGSAFKLYILAALVKDKRPWDQVIKLEDRYKSLPSGDLQT